MRSVQRAYTVRRSGMEIIMRNEKIQKLVMTGVFAALSYVVFTFLQIKISLPGGDATSIHLGNAVCVLGALIMGGLYGGAGGAIGMTIGDLFDPIYIVSAPKTFVLKLFIGLVAGWVGHGLLHLSKHTGRSALVRATVAAASGMLFNAVFDPLVGYFYKLYILGKPAAEVALAWDIGVTAFNAVTNTIVAVLLYMVLRPALARSGLFRDMLKN